jgi:hypothetical protein
MALSHSPSIATSGLTIFNDPANRRSYTGTGGTTYDLCNFYNGNLTNGVGFTSSNNGLFSFDGTNDYIEIPTLSINSSFSIDLFCYAFNLSTTYVIVGKYGGGAYDFWLGISAGRFKFSISMANKIEPQTANISANTWYNLVAVYNSSALTASIYLNGVLAQTLNGSSAFQNPPGNYAIGAFGAAGSFYFPGYVASHKFYNRALSASEIKQNFNANRDRFGI